jgi:SAM-dependent methyltransferase
MITNDSELPWFESDEFWVTWAPFMFDEERLAGTSEEIDRIIQFIDLEPGNAILDMGCGPGRHSLELARRGFMVTGVDRTEFYLQKAIEAARAEGLDVEFLHRDMREFLSPDAFGAAISLFTSFGYFENQSENQLVLKNIYDSLKPGGTLVLDTMGKEVLARIFIERIWEEKDGTLFLREHNISRDWSWLESRCITVRKGEQHEFKISHWVYSAVELKTMLVEAGFKNVEIFGNLDSEPYDHTAKRLVSVAHK